MPSFGPGTVDPASLCAGTVVGTNLLWKLGHHTQYAFFELSHKTERGNWMAYPLEREVVRHWSAETGDRAVRVGGRSEDKVRRLKGGHYEVIERPNEEVREKDCGPV
jgi:hypothetical protein